MNFNRNLMSAIKKWYTVVILLLSLFLMHKINYGDVTSYSVSPIYVLSVVLLYLDGKSIIVPTVNTLLLVATIYYYQANVVVPARVVINMLSIIIINGIIWGERYHRLTVYDLVNKKKWLERRNGLRETLNRIERNVYKLRSVQDYFKSSDPIASKELAEIGEDLINIVTVGDGLLQLVDEKKALLNGELGKESG